MPPTPHIPVAARCGVPSDLEEEACLYLQHGLNPPLDSQPGPACPQATPHPPGVFLFSPSCPLNYHVSLLLLNLEPTGAFCPAPEACTGPLLALPVPSFITTPNPFMSHTPT